MSIIEYKYKQFFPHVEYNISFQTIMQKDNLFLILYYK